jgi:hypothetical protein
MRISTTRDLLSFALSAGPRRADAAHLTPAAHHLLQIQQVCSSPSRLITRP